MCIWPPPCVKTSDGKQHSEAGGGFKGLKRKGAAAGNHECNRKCLKYLASDVHASIHLTAHTHSIDRTVTSSDTKLTEARTRVLTWHSGTWNWKKSEVVVKDKGNNGSYLCQVPQWATDCGYCAKLLASKLLFSAFISPIFIPKLLQWQCNDSKKQHKQAIIPQINDTEGLNRHILKEG